MLLRDRFDDDDGAIETDETKEILVKFSDDNWQYKILDGIP